MLISYLQARHPPSLHCLGVRLHPLTLAHCFQLARLGSPFLVPAAAAPGPGDLALALEICRRPPPLFGVPPLGGLGLVLLRFRSRRYLRLSPDDFALALAAFQDYLAWNLTAPNHWRQAPSAHPARAPWELSLYQTLTARLHYSPAAALALPLRQALWEYCAWWESEGALSLCDSGDEALLEAARQMAAESPESP